MLYIRREDENHFLMHCNLYSDLRSEFYNSCTTFIFDFENMDSDTFFFNIMTYSVKMSKIH